jgi:hypothetical protein
MSIRTRTLTIAALVLFIGGPLHAQQTRDFGPYLIGDRAAEVALARTAAPKNVSDSATVLVLTRNGFVQAVRGTNGFTCAVFPSFSGSVDDPGFWNPKVRAPHCWNPPAARTVLPRMLQQVEWVLAGVSPTEIGARTSRAYAAHRLSKPAAGAMAYMLSHEQHLVDADPHWMPHLMFYYDKSMPATVWGAGGMTAPIIDASIGDSHSPVLTLLVPVRQWSDGTPALPVAGQ